MQNQGRLSLNKRDIFSYLTDEEIAEIENRIQAFLVVPPSVTGTP
jgi:flagellar motor switch protein FliG